MLTLGANATMLDLAWRLALMGIGFGLFNAPIITAIMAAAPAASAGTAGGVSAPARTIAMTISPTLMASCWILTGGGLAGFRARITALATIQTVGVLALLRAPARSSRRPR